MANTNRATDSHLGVAIDTVVTSANIANFVAAPQAALLETVRGNNSSQWIYVYASAAITQYAVVGIEASGTASMLTSTIARGATPVRIGIAQVAFANAGDRGWVATEGTALTVLTTAVCTAGAKLFTTATAGRVSTTQATATDAQIQGLVHSVTTGATASSSPCIANSLTFSYPTLLST